MYGAIWGDIVGSPFEFDSNNYKAKDFAFLSENSHFTDDTVVTVAVADALMNVEESGTETKVYFAHPYTSCEKGSIENHNGLLRRFIPKGKRIADYSDEDLLTVELWANGLPRKILGYQTPDEAFDVEMDKIFAA